jgi:predicted peroxiredoxin
MMKIFSSIVFVIGLMVSPVSVHAAEAVSKTFVVITSESVETQGMALVLSLQALKNGSDVRILLCDDGGDIAKKEYQGVALKPLNVTPQQLLKKAMSNGAKADVCALYLPNRGLNMDALIDGISNAKPPQIGTYMADPNVRYFTF